MEPQTTDTASPGQGGMVIKIKTPIAINSSSPPPKAWQYIKESVRPSGLAELQLILLTFSTGIQDAVSFHDFHCFASNQTGNTVFLILAIALPEMNGEMFVTVNIATALGIFLAAAWLTGQIGHIVGPRRRIYLVLCNLIQTLLVFVTAALQYREGIQLEGAYTLVSIGLLAFASGSQVVQSRSLRMTEITTAMATAAWVDLVIDPNLLTLKNRPRNRRVAFLAALILGTLVGAYIFKTLGSPAALVISGAGKLLVTVMYFFNSAEEEEKSDGGESV
ncbi:hypothetical protein B0T22DRAFT_102319 [Podospora appendiculata]|uniref:DUF1275 domain protein n=1 Tax=Podospora appendiculata TaxID=314037 RepID=A0AAE0XL89_9PEZI|nr:hypothetical protein B0T22DRAFT_102319 [Podospora appendiculata]